MIISPLDKGCLLELLPTHGGLCQRLAFTTAAGETVDVLAGCSDRELRENNPWYRGCWLYPFASRLADGRYCWQGRQYQLPLNEPARHNALHGLLNRVTPDVTVQETAQDWAHIVLRYHYTGFEPGYPFPAEISVDYLLQSPDSVTMTLMVRNLHDTSVPLGVGWHPYFSLGSSINDCSLLLPVADKVAVDDRLLPTGNREAFAAFNTLAPVGDLEIDASLALRQTTQTRVQALLWSAQRQKGIVLWQDAGANAAPGFRYLQVFIPPDRKSIALEPVSNGIDAFNTGENLLELAPDATASFQCGVHLVTVPGMPADFPGQKKTGA